MEDQPNKNIENEVNKMDISDEAERDKKRLKLNDFIKKQQTELAQVGEEQKLENNKSEQEQEYDDESEEEISKEYTLSKNEYLIYQFNNIFGRECDTTSLVKYIVMTLPGLTHSERVRILKDGPSIGGYSSTGEMTQYIFGRLNQYKFSDEYIKTNSNLPPIDESQYGTLHYSKYYITEDTKNHTVHLTNEPSLI